VPEQLPQHDSDEPRLRRLPLASGTLGAVLDFLSRDKFFGAIPLGRLVPAIRNQLDQQRHVCALRGKVIVGYCGWVLMTREMGEKWLKGEARFDVAGIPADQADAGALTIVRIAEPKLVLSMMRACRKLNPGRRVFFRREYLDRTRPSKMMSVANFTASGTRLAADNQAAGQRAASPEPAGTAGAARPSQADDGQTS